ncbi:MAG: serine hydrolase domain-containing protein [Candidatus Limnocylindrales bacterium]
MDGFDDALRSLDERFTGLQSGSRIPGVAWGVIRDGVLVHTGGAGTIRDGESLTPDADSVFRIASMTKSFTAAAVLLLRDEGRLRLDDDVAASVPALANWRAAAGDAGPVTVRQLLTMSGGLPTDDPWGDRQQSLPLDAFAELLAAGPALAWAPGTTFDYSNLGYAILGRVVTSASGREYREVVRDRLLEPLGMASTAYREEDVDPSRLARGYVRRDDVLVREGDDAYGAFASMGGIYSSVRDLARWVSGFLDALPARADPEGGHPLRRASRREMQQLQRSWGAGLDDHAAHEAPVIEAGGYGLGLFVISDAEAGTIIFHSGGYPGYGSVMAWHPATGLGIIALGNVRYAQVRPLALDELSRIVRSGIVAPRPVRRWPAVDAMRDVTERLLATWDDALADATFAMNMDLDEPRVDRRATVERLAADLGPFRRDETHPVTSASPAHLRWWLRGTRGWVRAGILVTPEPAPRLQAMALTGVLDPSGALLEAGERLASMTGEDAPGWPTDLVAAPGLDLAIARRGFAAIAARLGRVRLGRLMLGDGSTTATWELRPAAAAPDGEPAPDEGPARNDEAATNHDAAANDEAAKNDDASPVEAGPAPATLAITLDTTTGAITAVDVRFAERLAPAEAW